MAGFVPSCALSRMVVTVELCSQRRKVVVCAMMPPRDGNNGLRSMVSSETIGFGAAEELTEMFKQVKRRIGNDVKQKRGHVVVMQPSLE